MTKRIAMMFGTPGVGKSTLVWRLIDAVGEDAWEEYAIETLRFLHCDRLNLSVLGRWTREPDGSRSRYPGADRLSMSVQPIAERYIEETESSVLVEGDRFSNSSFIEHLICLDRDALVLNLIAEPEKLAMRQRNRGDDRTEKFLKARETKYANIRAHPLYRDNVRVMPNNDLIEHEAIWRVLSAHLEVNR
jgi:hypothetical protein